MGKKVNVERGKQGFQRTGPVSPPDHRGFFAKLFGRRPKSSVVADSNVDIPVPPSSYSAARNAYDVHRAMQASEPDYADVNRFGYDNTVHAMAETLVHDVRAGMQVPQSSSYIEDGKVHTVEMNFNPTVTVKKDVISLAYKVLDASGKFAGGKRPWNSDVYSAGTIAAAERIYNHGYGGDTFTTKYGDVAYLFPSRVSHPSRTHTEYQYGMHADVNTFMDDVLKDQKGHAGLQKAKEERAAHVQRLAMDLSRDPWADL